MNFESGDFAFSGGDATIVIAEVGVNHNGSVETAKSMVDAIRKAGAHVAKFQVFRAEKEISRYADKAQYQKDSTSGEGGQLEMCKALELSADALRQLKAYCATLGMPFLCTAFDFDSVDLLVDDLKVATIKVASGEITNLPFLEYVGSRRKAVVLSTGASTLSEVAIAVDTLRKAGCGELMLFHCVSSYPAPYAEANLRAMATLRDAFRVPVGFSDHCMGNQAALAAAALGASAIEKHFTLDKNMAGPDHQASIEPRELEELVLGVRAVCEALGDGRKVPVSCEIPNIPLIRKSLVAARGLRAGQRIERDMIEIKRPEGGIAPGDLTKILGLTLTRDVGEDMPVRWEDFA